MRYFYVVSRNGKTIFSSDSYSAIQTHIAGIIGRSDNFMVDVLNGYFVRYYSNGLMMIEIEY